MEVTQSSLTRDSLAMNETNDCTVRCIAVVTGVAYEKAHEICRRNGRKNRRGMYDYQWKRALRDLGYKLIDRTDEVRRAGGKTTRTVVNVLPTRPHIVHSYRHVSAWSGTKLVDWADGRLKRVQAVYEVVRDTDLKPVAIKGYNAPAKPRKNIDALPDMLKRGPVDIYRVRTVYGADDKEARALLGRARTALRKENRDLVLVAKKTWRAS